MREFPPVELLLSLWSRCSDSKLSSLIPWPVISNQCQEMLLSACKGQGDSYMGPNQSIPAPEFPATVLMQQEQTCSVRERNRLASFDIPRHSLQSLEHELLRTSYTHVSSFHIDPERLIES